MRPSCWVRASMPVGGSDAPIWARACWPPTTRCWRAIETEVQDAAIRQADDQAADNPHLLFLAGAGWHPGVIGIVAGRLKERYQRPVCVIALDGGVGKASGRSVAGLHLGQAIIAAREAGLVLKGGGHAMAAGFEVQEDRLAALQAFIAARFKDDL